MSGVQATGSLQASTWASQARYFHLLEAQRTASQGCCSWQPTHSVTNWGEPGRPSRRPVLRSNSAGCPADTADAAGTLPGATSDSICRRCLPTRQWGTGVRCIQRAGLAKGEIRMLADEACSHTSVQKSAFVCNLKTELRVATVTGNALVYHECNCQLARKTCKVFQKGATCPHAEVG